MQWYAMDISCIGLHKHGIMNWSNRWQIAYLPNGTQDRAASQAPSRAADDQHQLFILVNISTRRAI
jgi:hypothetical protein